MRVKDWWKQIQDLIKRFKPEMVPDYSLRTLNDNDPFVVSKPNFEDTMHHPDCLQPRFTSKKVDLMKKDPSRLFDSKFRPHKKYQDNRKIIEKESIVKLTQLEDLSQVTKLQKATSINCEFFNKQYDSRALDTAKREKPQPIFGGNGAPLTANPKGDDKKHSEEWVHN